MTYVVTAQWMEFRELEFESLDEASTWARKLLADEPAASVSVNGDGFWGSWFVPATIPSPSTSTRPR